MAEIKFVEVAMSEVVSFIKSKIHQTYGTAIATVKWTDEKSVVCSVFSKDNESTTQFAQIELMCSNGPAVSVGDKLSVALKGAKFEIVSTPRSMYATYKIKSDAQFRIFREKDCGEVIESGTF